MILFFLLLSLSGCINTQIRYQAVIPEVLRLAEALEDKSQVKKINLKITNSFKKKHLGNQYLLLFFPVGKIIHLGLTQQLLQEFYQELTLRDFAIDDSVETRLLIDINYVQISAYDLLITRNIVIKLKLTASYQINPTSTPLIKTINFKYREFTSLPFGKKLSQIYRKALKKSVKKTINELWSKNITNSNN